MRQKIFLRYKQDNIFETANIKYHSKSAFYVLVLADVAVTLLDVEHAHAGGGGGWVVGRLDVAVVLVNGRAARVGHN